MGVGGGAPGQSEDGADGSASEEDEASSSQESGAVEARGLREVERVREEREVARAWRLRSATLMVEVGRLRAESYDAGSLNEDGLLPIYDSSSKHIRCNEKGDLV